METRPTPTIRLILGLIGGDEKLLKKVYRGLNETSLNGIYSNLNLDEALAFAGISWGERWRDINQYATQTGQMELYGIINSTMGRGMAALNSAKKIPEEDRELYSKLNPFEGNLKERLERVSEQDEAALRDALRQPAKFYASEGQYQSGHARSNAESEGRELVVMGFLPVYLGKANPETVKKGYATEIARMVKAYPRAFEPFMAVPVKIERPKQLQLL